EQLVGNRQRELADQEDAEHGGDPRDQNSQPRVDQAERFDLQEERQDAYLRRHHERREEHGEQAVAAFEPELRERVARRGVAEQRDRGDRKRKEQAVQERPAEMKPLEQRRVMFERRPARQPTERQRERLARGHEGGRDHPEQRQQSEHRDEY